MQQSIRSEMNDWWRVNATKRMLARMFGLFNKTRRSFNTLDIFFVIFVALIECQKKFPFNFALCVHVQFIRTRLCAVAFDLNVFVGDFRWATNSIHANTIQIICHKYSSSTIIKLWIWHCASTIQCKCGICQRNQNVSDWANVSKESIHSGFDAVSNE